MLFRSSKPTNGCLVILRTVDILPRTFSNFRKSELPEIHSKAKQNYYQPFYKRPFFWLCFYNQNYSFILARKSNLLIFMKLFKNPILQIVKKNLKKVVECNKNDSNYFRHSFSLLKNKNISQFIQDY